MSCTEGDWKVFERLDGTIWICLNKLPVYPLIVKIDANFPEEHIANANLIVAAVNACKQVNPDNPMAVAESISDMSEALYELYEWVAENVKLGTSDTVVMETIDNAQKALAKAGGK